MLQQRFPSSFVFTALFIFFVAISGCTSQPLTPKEQFKPQTLSTEELQKSCLRGLTAACALIDKAMEPQQKHPVLQGASSSTETTLVVQRQKSENLVYAVRRTDQNKLKDWSYAVFETRSRSFSDYVEDQIHLSGLKSDKGYEFLVFDDGGMLKDQRFFHTLNSKKKNAKINIASCMNDTYMDVAKQIWPEFMDQKPDAIFLIGDNVYADKATVNFGPATAEILWNRYVETRQSLPLFYSKTLTPVFAIWDDHDYGKNSGDRTFEHREASRQVFLDFFPQDHRLQDVSRGDSGLTYSLFAFSVNWFFMDNRFERSPNGLRVADETQWGVGNEKWLEQRLKANPWPAFVIEGDQFFGGYHPFESYENNHPESFKNFFLKTVKSTSKPMLFMSGDRHLTEIIIAPKDKLGYQTYELTSSGIHSTRYPHAYEKNPNPHMLVGVPGEYNYMVLDLKEVKPRSITIQVESFGLNNKKFYSKILTVKK